MNLIAEYWEKSIFEPPGEISRRKFLACRLVLAHV